MHAVKQATNPIKGYNIYLVTVNKDFAHAP